MGNSHVTIYCEYVTKNHVHCNRYIKLDISMDDCLKDVIDASDWDVVNGEIRCPEDIHEDDNE